MGAVRGATPLGREGDSTTTPQDLRVPSARRATYLFVVVALVAFIVLFAAGRHGTFYHDEWHLANMQGLGSFDDWMRPWHVHWVLVPTITWRAIFVVVGFASYLPYLAVLVILHLIAAAGLFTLVRRASGDALALCTVTVFLFLGSAWQNLFWAFQYSFVISTASGLWAMVAFQGHQRRARALGAGLVMVSLASSGMGVPFALALGVELLADPRRRRAIGWLIPPAVAFLIWYIVWGRSGVATPPPAGSNVLGTVASFVVFGPVSYIHALLGIGMPGEGILAIGAAVTVAALAFRRSLPPPAFGAVAGLVVLLAMIALGRGVFGVGTTGQPRYVYEGVVFVLLLASSLVGRRAAHKPSTRGETVLATAIATITIVALARNLPILQASGTFVDAAGELRAVIALTARYGAERLDAPIPPGDRFVIPPPIELERMMAAHGRLDTDRFRPSLVVPPTPEQRDRALWRVLGGTVRPTVSTAPSPVPLPTLLEAHDVTISGRCLTVAPLGSVTMELAAGRSVALRGPGRWVIGLGHEVDPQQTSVLNADIGDSWQRIAVPGIGAETPYRLLLRSLSSTPATVCAAPD